MRAPVSGLGIELLWVENSTVLLTIQARVGSHVFLILILMLLLFSIYIGPNVFFEANFNQILEQ